MTPILFLEDWDKHPNAIVDLKTRNKSYLILAKKYKKMGIKNHSFMLALYNPKLQGVDPHDPDLTFEQVLAVTHECKVNFWYYIREVAKFPAISGDEADDFRANRGNIASYWMFWNHITQMLIQPRQTGKSAGTDQLSRYLLNIGMSNSKMALFTKMIN